jgi:hypothetical protein
MGFGFRTGRESRSAMTIKMEFGDFDRQLREAQLTVELLNRHVGQVKFNPNEPADIERAIIEMEGIVDERLAKYRSNEIIDQFIAETKKAYREQILKLAATALQSAGHKVPKSE